MSKCYFCDREIEGKDNVCDFCFRSLLIRPAFGLIAVEEGQLLVVSNYMQKEAQEETIVGPPVIIKGDGRTSVH